MRMNFDIADILAFVAIAENGNFQRAADSLNTTQPSLSRRLQKLERALDARLIDRTTRSVKLTLAGSEFLARARRLLADLDETVLALSGVSQGRAGIVTIASVPSAMQFYLPSVIEQFSARLPRVRVRLLDLSANDVMTAVQEGEADFGINFLPSEQPGLTFLPLKRDPFFLAMRQDHAFAGRREIRWSDLSGTKVIAVWKGSGNRLLIDLELARAGKSLDWFYEVRHLTTSLGLVEAGLGVAALPQSALPGPDHPILVSRPLVDPPIARTIGTIRRAGARLSASATVFHDLLVGLQADEAAP